MSRRRNPIAMAAGLAAVAAAMALVIREAQPSSPPAPPPPPRKRRSKRIPREVVIEGLIGTYPGLSVEDAARIATAWPGNFIDAPARRDQ
ncbi:hypothetical protein MKK50_15730 [Methylobacterium sp. J-043]|jgi:hypothetical protein|uniref:Uncharacterized protein n=1 Tax=Methylobacterium goesingense TaxID=243690 RepID=A0ABV2L870_9HYPH|nr:MULTISPECIES: hypothetical protein [Methylobacteriaceae]MCJ2030822.1 hypothetical protein [Methylobacterium sp. J-043]KQP04901.1 hypothetical protein ASF28_18920 [Methylobacterium sp. Leaf99]KQT49083.1 hypothetical protein ASG52_08880 [Methylobacterium sp. Leaf456]UYW33824.1 hypothetical protein OKB92_07015 [Methylorubrum extorquens]GJD74510.1 hypothetical protein CFIICLFH_2744 [Methylobacterium goesingense]